MKNLLIILMVVVFSACGSKKKITDVKKGYEYAQVSDNKTVEERKEQRGTDTSKIKKKVSEQEKERIIEKYIFDDAGRVKEYTKETERDRKKDTDIDEVKGLTGSLLSVGKITSNFDSVGEKKEYTDKSTLDKKAPSPIANWLGAGIFVAVIIVVGYFLLKKG